MSRQTEYTSVFSPVDAESVQGKDRMNPLTSEGLHRINSLINNHLAKGVLNPHATIAELKVKLNHMNLDFPFDNNTEVTPSNTYSVSHGDVFGVTPTTNLMAGFDRGQDLPKYKLTINMGKNEYGYSLNGKLEPADSTIAEAVEYKIKKKKGIEKTKKMLKEKKMKASKKSKKC
jgi:hypothetical protein